MTTVDHNGRHIWVRTPVGVRCAYLWCNAKAEPADVAKMEGEEALVRQQRDEAN